MSSSSAMALILLSLGVLVAGAAVALDCGTVTSLVSACSTFITYGSPDPFPGSPCCDAMMGLNMFGETIDDRRSICRCIMGLIATYNPNASAIATLPGFCGVSLGFTINPNTDCNYIL